MDQIDLVQIRKNLHNFETLGKNQTISLLRLLGQSDIPDEQFVIIKKSQLRSSKIYKTLSVLSLLKVSREIDQEFTEQDIKTIRDLSKCLVLKMKDTMKNGKLRKIVNQIAEPVTSTKASNHAIQELVEDLVMPKDFPILRRKVIERLITVMMDHIETSSVVTQYSGIRYAQLCQKLEDEANFKYQGNQYRDIIKEMIRNIHHDLDFTIRQRLLRGLIEPSQAILMRISDWSGIS